MTTADLRCPKCEGAMRSYECNGVTIDQCADCRGVFLDRGELERLIQAEGTFYETLPQPRKDSRPIWDGEQSSGHGKRKRGGFLGELFD